MTDAAPADQPAFEAGVGATFDTSDPALLADAVPGWQVEYLQLGHGRFHGHIVLGQTAHVQFLTKEWNTGMLVRGFAPAGISVLGGPLSDAADSLVRGRAIEENEVGFVRPGLELDFRSLTACQLFMIALPDLLLEQHAQAILGKALTELTRGSRLRLRTSITDLNHWVTRLDLPAICREPARLADPVVAGWIENQLLDGLIDQVATDDRPSVGRGDVRLARRVDAYLRDNLAAPLTIVDLCTAMGAPDRTVHQAVRTYLGATPKALLKTMRLNAVRRELKEAQPGTQVMDVARRWGFLHPGWFSLDYREQFGESPSATLRAPSPEPAAGVR